MLQFAKFSSFKDLHSGRDLSPYPEEWAIGNGDNLLSSDQPACLPLLHTKKKETAWWYLMNKNDFDQQIKFHLKRQEDEHLTKH